MYDIHAAKFESLAAEKKELIALERKIAEEKLEQNKGEHVQRTLENELCIRT